MTGLQYWIDTKKGESPVRDWDKLRLGEYTFPGLARVWSTKKLDVDINKEHTTDKAGTVKPKEPSLTDNGRQPGTLKAQIEVWDPKDWEKLQIILKAVWPTKELTDRDAYNISHPSPALVGIDKVLVTEIVVPPPMEQSLVVELTLLEFFHLRSRQQKKTHSTDSNAPPDADKVPPVDPGKNLKK